MAFSKKNQEIMDAGKASLSKKVEDEKAKGMSNAAIAHKLGLAESTVRRFLSTLP